MTRLTSLPTLSAGLVLAFAGIAHSHAADVVVLTDWGYDCSYTAVVREADGDRTVVHGEAYPWCRGAKISYYAYRYGYAYGYGYAYANPSYVPPAGVVYGPYGAAAWGPYGGVAATTGTRYYHTDNVWGATRASAAYNPWTGNAAAAQTKAGYNANTGTRAVGQRGGVANAYTGDYAYGERGAVYNENTGAAAAGSHGTVGNAYTGNEAQVGRGAVYNPNTGETSTAAGIHTDNGSVVRVNDDVYVGHDGDVQQVDPTKRATQDNKRQPGTARTNATPTRPEGLRKPEGARRPEKPRRREGGRSQPALRR